MLTRQLRDAPVSPVTRFAPSPTGYLHLGHVVNAIYVWGVAGALGGAVLLRLEDHDRTRCRPEFEAAILEDLAWLGFIAPGPRGTIRELSRQSNRHAIYQRALERLRKACPVYACDCSRAEIKGERYSGRCRDRHVPERPGVGVRVHMPETVERFDDLLLGPLEQQPARQCGDLLLRDRDGHWTYQFAVTVDDLDQGVTLVIRGADLVSSTGRQRSLARSLLKAGACDSRPLPVYLHHPLVLGADGKKLSKSTGAAGVRAMRQRGLSPSEVIGAAAVAAGLIATPVPIPANNVVTLFTRNIDDTEDAGRLPRRSDV
jgi:glutamyl-tRNA synthetase/glutamyl-Q tRNA(Asp) synthetase